VIFKAEKESAQAGQAKEMFSFDKLIFSNILQTRTQTTKTVIIKIIFKSQFVSQVLFSRIFSNIL
jgi:hypothetical protein